MIEDTDSEVANAMWLSDSHPAIAAVDEVENILKRLQWTNWKGGRAGMEKIFRTVQGPPYNPVTLLCHRQHLHETVR